MGILGSISSFLIRLQLSQSETDLLSPSSYNTLVTAHGLIMIFFFVMPVLIGGFGK